MTKELTKKTTAAVAVPQQVYDDGDFEAKDLLVPMLCVAQAMSDAVKTGKAKPGDLYETVSKTVLGDAKKAVKFVPVKFFKTWVHCELVKGRPEYRSVEAYSTANSNKYQYEETREDGTTWRNFEVLNFYILLEDELKAGTPFPYLLSFRSSNKKKGRPLINHLARARALNPPQPLCSMTFNLTSILTSNAKDSWFVFDLTPANPTSKEYVEKSIEWLQTLNAMTHKIDEAGLREEMNGAEEVEVAPAVKKNEVSKEARY